VRQHRLSITMSCGAATAVQSSWMRSTGVESEWTARDRESKAFGRPESSSTQVSVQKKDANLGGLEHCEFD